MGLLYGQGDYTKTIEISTRCGQDSDCNPASAAGILGTMIGYDKIPENWKSCLASVADRNFAHTDISLNKTYELGLKHSLQVIGLNGGKVAKEKVTIKVQPVQPTRYEKSFDGMVPYKKVGLGNKPIDKAGEIKFYGCGIVVRGVLKADDEKYVGEMDVYLDGKKVKTMKLPASYHARSNDLYWNFEMEEGNHVLTFKRLNPQDNVTTQVQSAVLFKKSN